MNTTGRDITSYRAFDGWSSDDPTVRARARGRSITFSLARLVAESDRGGFWMDMRTALAGQPVRYNPKADDGRYGDGLVPENALHGDELRHVWKTHIDPSGGWGPQ